MLQYNPTVSGSLTITGSLTVTNGVIGTVSGVDVQIFSSSINQVITGIQSSTGSSDARLSFIETFTASNDNTSLNSKTGSYATTGSNSFYGTQVFSGSVFIANDLVVQGSSSIQYISASSVSIGTNIVQLNTATPSVRYAGISVQDSGSSAGITGSLLWDSLCNRWMYSNPSGVGYSGGILMSGPRATNLGEETTLTCNYIAKSGGGDHLYDSCIYESGGCVGINTNSPSYTLDVSGSIGRIKNAGGSTDFILDRASTSAGATHQYNTAGNLKWYTGLRGLVNNNFYIFNHATSTNSLIIDETTNNAIFACGISVGRSDQMYRLNIFNDVTKTCTTARGLAFFGSNDSLASAPFGLVITSQGGATISNRVVRMGTTDFGLANGGLLELNGTLFVCNSGCVGIGNSSPNTMLHTTIATPYGTNGTVLNSYPVATFSQCDCASGARGLQIGVPTGGVVSPVYLKVTNTGARFSILDQSNCEDFTITGNKVGIGTTSPGSILHIKGGSAGGADFGAELRVWENSFGAVLQGSTVASTEAFLGNFRYNFNTPANSVTNYLTAGHGILFYDGVHMFASAPGGTSGGTFTPAERLTINNIGHLGVSATSPRTRLQVTPSYNAEIPILGCAHGVATFTSANTNYGLQFNSTSDGSFHIQSQRFDASETAYALGLNSVGGCVYLGKGWGATNHRINLEKPQGCTILVVSAYSGASNDSVIISAASGAGYNGALTVMGVTTNSSTGRSISAGGSITGGGNDYAEYIVKRNDAGCIQKGQIAGIDSCKLLTDKWSLACSFVVKSTDPSFVGGDSWDKHIGNRPQQTTCITDEEFAPILTEYEEKLEEARNKVDRIAFSGQVPVIVSGSYNVGDYILPIEGPDDTIVGVACSLSSLTLEDYGKTIGKVWGTCLDKAWVAVKIG